MSDQNSTLTKLLHFIDENQAIDVKVIDVHKQTTVTDYMIVVSGRSSRQVKAIAQKVMEDMKKEGFPAINCNGLETGEWVLVDFGDFILHVMQPDYRQYYNLEGLWEELPKN